MKLYVVTARKLLSNLFIVAALVAVIGLNFNQTKSVFKNESSCRFTMCRERIRCAQ